MSDKPAYLGIDFSKAKRIAKNYLNPDAVESPPVEAAPVDPAPAPAPAPSPTPSARSIFGL